MVITTYGTRRRDVVDLKDARFDDVVLDEAQAVKNAGGLRLIRTLTCEDLELLLS